MVNTFESFPGRYEIRISLAGLLKKLVGPFKIVFRLLVQAGLVEREHRVEIPCTLFTMMSSFIVRVNQFGLLKGLQGWFRVQLLEIFLSCHEC